MGMYDSFYINCPKCKHELEFQSKSGSCMLAVYGKVIKGVTFSFKKLSPDVAVGINGDVVRCQFCDSRLKLVCNIPISINAHVEIVKKRKFDYNGNYNPKHPASVKEKVELRKQIGRASCRERV